MMMSSGCHPAKTRLFGSITKATIKAIPTTLNNVTVMIVIASGLWSATYSSENSGRPCPALSAAMMHSFTEIFDLD